MPSQTHRRNRTVILLIIVALLLSLGIVCYKCCHTHGKTVTTPWANWNILFNNGVPGETRAQIVRQVEDSVTQYLIRTGADTSKVQIRFQAYVCPCDTTLANIDITLIYPEGNPVPPTPPGGVAGAMGGSVHHLWPNQRLSSPERNNQSAALKTPTHDTIQFFGHAPQHPGPTNTTDRILAFIDTGLDSTEFSVTVLGSVSSLIWSDPNGNKTLYNFLPGADPYQLKDDDTSSKHGTSAAYISLLAASPRYPRIMPLKALDSTGNGSVFTVSCAMSYALQHKVSAINASLGYFGSADPILQHYFKEGDSLKIPIVTAAGNDSSANLTPDSICSDVLNPLDLLSGSNLFYPACFSDDMPYVISVTGINRDTLPCYYQNYGSSHVDVGVLLINPSNASVCCSFYIPFLDKGAYVEGSSFSTPVISGRLISAIPRANPHPLIPGEPASTFDPRAWLTGIYIPTLKLKPYIKSSAFVIYAY